jgi:hypothetical protein
MKIPKTNFIAAPDSAVCSTRSGFERLRSLRNQLPKGAGIDRWSLGHP